MRKYLSLLKSSCRSLMVYILGHLYAFRRYDKKYLKGRWFQGEFNGSRFRGWEWVCSDARNCRRLNVNGGVPWPVSAQITVLSASKITFHPDDLNNFQGIGNYYQGHGGITIGRGSYIANNVGLITANHDLDNLDIHAQTKPIVIGERCWIGMNSVLLPGVTLGDKTIVGAGSVVTKSFPYGNCVIAGNPARKIRDIPPTESEK